MTSDQQAKMRAVGWTTKASGVLPTPCELEMPLPTPGQLRVQVISSAVNPADLKVSRGEFSGRFLHASVEPLIVGYDFSGVVEQCGADVRDYRVGDAVFGFLPYAASTRQGAFAELITVDQGSVARLPEGVSHMLAAAAATPGLTALQSLRDLGKVKPGGRVLLVGAAGGVGTLAIGVAKKLGAHVTAVCSGYATDFVRELGADEVVDRRKQDPLTLTGPYDMVLDTPSAHGYWASRHQLAAGGTYVATLPSPGVFMGKLAAGMAGKHCEFITVKPLAADLELLGAWLASGLRVPLAARFPVRELQAALDQLAKGTVQGRIGIDVENGF